jgi:opacity protein-like surface antigen
LDSSRLKIFERDQNRAARHVVLANTHALNNAIAFSAPSANRFGWTIGVGTEWAIVDNWSVFGEWDYMNFGTNNITFTDANLGSSQISVKQQINVLKLGVNYRFGSPLPQQYP